MADEVKSEPDVFPGVATAATMVCIMVFVALCVGALWIFYPSVHEGRMRPPTAFPAPTLEVSPVRDYNAYLIGQKAMLAGGAGRMPIEDAMATIIRNGAFDPEVKR